MRLVRRGCGQGEGWDSQSGLTFLAQVLGLRSGARAGRAAGSPSCRRRRTPQECALLSQGASCEGEGCAREA